MSELLSISKSRVVSEPTADVIFVHGLGGSTNGTWQHDKDAHTNSWPFWLSEDNPNISIHCLEYDASPSNWYGNSMPLIDRATNILTLFESHSIGERPLCFVCHSLGGLVVKQAIRTAREFDEPYWQCLVENTRGIAFLATPHSGAHVANYLSVFAKVIRQSVNLKELGANAPALRELNVWYRQNSDNMGIRNISMYETQNTRGFRIVDETSADVGIGVPRAIDADHFSICKPNSRSSLVHKSVSKFLTNCLNEKKKS